MLWSFRGAEALVHFNHRDLLDPDRLADALTRAGLGPRAAEEKAEWFARAAAKLSVESSPAPRPEISAFFVPGRIEILGKHTDYAGGQALAQGDLGRFGRLVDGSQRAAEQLLGNQIPQTIHLAAAARECGAAAASAFGAGFGGSVWAMVEQTYADSFLTAWADAYGRKFPQNAPASTFFLTAAGPAALRVC